MSSVPTAMWRCLRQESVDEIEKRQREDSRAYPAIAGGLEKSLQREKICKVNDKHVRTA